MKSLSERGLMNSVLDQKGCFDRKIEAEDRRELFNLLMTKRMFLRKNIRPVDAEDLIKRSIKDHGKFLALAWSGGRCSTVVLYMALRLQPKIKVVYNNTGIDFSENVKYVHDLAKLWNINLTETRPKARFWKDIVPTYGLPQMRTLNKGKLTKREREGFSKKSHGVPICCDLLKEEPAHMYYIENRISAVLTGMRASESRVRAVFIGQNGQEYIKRIKRTVRHNTHIYMPIALWTPQQVRDYLKDNNIPHNHVYDTQSRNGCWPCTAYVKWEENLKRYSPRLYAFVKREFEKERTQQFRSWFNIGERP